MTLPTNSSPEYIPRLLLSRQQYLLEIRKTRQAEIAKIEDELSIIKHELEALQCAPQS